MGQRGEGRQEDWKDYCDSRHNSPMFLVAGVLPCAPPGNGAWGTPGTSWLQRRSKVRVDGRVVVFSAVPQASASPLLTSLYGKGYEASFFFVTDCLVWSVCLQ